MSTHAKIGILYSNGNIESIYLHHDGYIQHCGVILQNHYTEINKIKQLINLGSISSIAEHIGEQHNSWEEHKDWCFAYTRDYGESPNNNTAIKYSNISEFERDV